MVRREVRKTNRLKIKNDLITQFSNKNSFQTIKLDNNLSMSVFIFYQKNKISLKIVDIGV